MCTSAGSRTTLLISEAWHQPMQPSPSRRPFSASNISTLLLVIFIWGRFLLHVLFHDGAPFGATSRVSWLLFRPWISVERLFSLQQQPASPPLRAQFCGVRLLRVGLASPVWWLRTVACTHWTFFRVHPPLHFQHALGALSGTTACGHN